MRSSESTKALASAIVRAVAGLGPVEQTGWHNQQNYPYLSDDDIVAATSRALQSVGLAVAPVQVEMTETPYTTGSKKEWVRCLATVTYRVVDSGSGEWLDVVGAGQGTDEGDKAAYKAQLGAFKVAMRSLLLICPAAQPTRAGRERGGTGHVPADAGPSSPRQAGGQNGRPAAGRYSPPPPRAGAQATGRKAEAPWDQR